jgi:uncharacterized membrane protein
MAEFVNATGILALTIGANFTGDLFGCGIKRELTENPLVKHFVAYLLLLFFVVLTNKDSFINGQADNSWVTLKLLFNTFLVYLLFIAFTKCTFGISVFVIAVLLFIMMMNIEEGNKTDPKIKADIADYKYYAIVAGIGAVVYGLISNASKQMQDHGADFTWYKFFLGTTRCAWEKQ